MRSEREKEMESAEEGLREEEDERESGGEGEWGRGIIDRLMIIID